MSKLFYIIGASGAGKDTLMNYAREKINGSQKVIFVHRYITRPPLAGNENHVHLTEREFKARIEANLFALHWESHGKYYGIGVEIINWMQLGFNVIVNGSREYLPIARQHFPKLVTVLIDASPDIIAERLLKRGREDATEIKKRLNRTKEISTDLNNCVKILNDSAIEIAGDLLVQLICENELKLKGEEH